MRSCTTVSAAGIVTSSVLQGHHRVYAPGSACNLSLENFLLPKMGGFLLFGTCRNLIHLVLCRPSTKIQKHGKHAILLKTGTYSPNSSALNVVPRFDFKPNEHRRIIDAFGYETLLPSSLGGGSVIRTVLIKNIQAYQTILVSALKCQIGL